MTKRLQEPEHGFKSYGQVQQWLAEKLGVEAEYHAVYQMTRYRLLRQAQGGSPPKSQARHRAASGFSANLELDLELLVQHYRQVRQDQRPIRYWVQDESRFGLKTIVGRLITACGIKPIGSWQ